MPQLAEWLIKIDSLYASAKNYASIKNCFVEYGILTRDTRDIEFEDKTAPLLVNSFGFTYKGEPLEIQFGQTKLVDIGLYTSQGKMIYEQFNQIGNAFWIDSKNLSPGFYYLTVYSHTNNKYYTFKLIKQ